MSEHRFGAHATLRPGESERRTDGSPLQLVRVVLSDDGVVLAPDGSEHERPDVICPLRPTEARELAAELLAAAVKAEQ